MKNLAFLTLITAGSLSASAKSPPSMPDPLKCPQEQLTTSLCPFSATGQWSGKAELSLLAWQAREDGLVFAVKNNPDFPSDTVDMNGTLSTPHFSWSPALKLNFDVGFTNTWDLDLRWTSFYSKSTNSIHAETTSSGGGIYPIFYLPTAYIASPTVFGKARSVWQVHLNTVDIELGIQPQLTSKINLRLHGGLKAAWIFQHLSASYSEGITVGGVTALPSRAAFEHQFTGGGPRIGVQSAWKLRQGWSLLASCAGALELGRFKSNREDSDNAVDSPTTYVRQSTFHEAVYVLRPVFEMLTGFGWDMTYGKRDQCAFGLQVAYEVQYYWAQNLMSQLATQQMSFTAFQSRGDLHFHGITLNFRFGF